MKLSIYLLEKLYVHNSFEQSFIYFSEKKNKENGQHAMPLGRIVNRLNKDESTHFGGSNQHQIPQNNN